MTQAIPTAPEAEAAIIRLALVYRDAVDIGIERDLRSSDFHDANRGRLWRWLVDRATAGLSWDAGLLLGDMRDDPAPLAALALEIQRGPAPDRGNADRYACRVVERSQLRDVIDACAAAGGMAVEGQSAPLDEVLSAVEARVFDATTRRRASRRLDLGEVAQQVAADIDRAAQTKVVPGVGLGLPTLDNHVRWQPGDLVILGARPNHGKTALAMQIAMSLAMQGEVVAIGQLEMTAHQLAMRWICSEVGCTFQALLAGSLNRDQWGGLVAAVDKLTDLRDLIHIDDTPRQTPAHFASFVRRVRRKCGSVSLAIFDHLHIAGLPRGADRYEGITAVTGGLKGAAKDCGTAVLALAQLNRGVDERQDQHPILRDFRDSGSIEQDADGVLALTRPARWTSERKEGDDNRAHLDLLKGRNAPPTKVLLAWDGPRFTFEDLGFRYE